MHFVSMAHLLLSNVDSKTLTLIKYVLTDPLAQPYLYIQSTKGHLCLHLSDHVQVIKTKQCNLAATSHRKQLLVPFLSAKTISRYKIIVL